LPTHNTFCGNQNGENNGTNQACNLKFQKISHPDLHFAYPTVTTEEVKKTQKY
jgi:DNA polymerase-3 subunit delta'